MSSTARCSPRRGTTGTSTTAAASPTRAMAARPGRPSPSSPALRRPPTIRASGDSTRSSPSPATRPSPTTRSSAIRRRLPGLRHATGNQIQLLATTFDAEEGRRPPTTSYGSYRRCARVDARDRDHDRQARTAPEGLKRHNPRSRGDHRRHRHRPPAPLRAHLRRPGRSSTARAARRSTSPTRTTTARPGPARFASVTQATSSTRTPRRASGRTATVYVSLINGPNEKSAEGQQRHGRQVHGRRPRRGARATVAHRSRTPTPASPTRCTAVARTSRRPSTATGKRRRSCSTTLHRRRSTSTAVAHARARRPESLVATGARQGRRRRRSSSRGCRLRPNGRVDLVYYDRAATRVNDAQLRHAVLDHRRRRDLVERTPSRPPASTATSSARASRSSIRPTARLLPRRLHRRRLDGHQGRSALDRQRATGARRLLGPSRAQQD